MIWFETHIIKLNFRLILPQFEQRFNVQRQFEVLMIHRDLSEIDQSNSCRWVVLLSIDSLSLQVIGSVRSIEQRTREWRDIDSHWTLNFEEKHAHSASFVDHFCYLCFVFVIISCLFIAALWSPTGKGLTSWLSCM